MQKRGREQHCALARAEDLHLWQLQMSSVSQMQPCDEAQEQAALPLLPCSSFLPHAHTRTFLGPLESRCHESSIVCVLQL